MKIFWPAHDIRHLSKNKENKIVDKNFFHEMTDHENMKIKRMNFKERISVIKKIKIIQKSISKFQVIR